MEVIPSGSFLEEFTLVADKAVEERERFLIQRKSGRNVVLLSMDDYNEMQKELYAARQAQEHRD